MLSLHRLALALLAFSIPCFSVAQVADAAPADNTSTNQVIVLPGEVPADRPVALRIDLTKAAELCGVKQLAPAKLHFSVPAQFIPDPVCQESQGQDPSEQQLRGILICRLPADFQSQHGGKIYVSFDSETKETSTPSKAFDGIVRNDGYEIVQKPEVDGGFPSQITFLKSGKKAEKIEWFDRVHKKDLGGFRVGTSTEDPSTQNTVELISQGPIATVVRVSANYNANGKRPDSNPSAVYDWFYFKGSPLVLVTMVAKQDKLIDWDEFHFLELHSKGKEFPHWIAGGDPIRKESFAEKDKAHTANRWAAIHDGQNAIGTIQAGQITIYDGKSFGPYLLPYANTVWAGWKNRENYFATWLWIGSADDLGSVIKEADANPPLQCRAVVTTEKLYNRIAELQKQSGQSGIDLRRRILLAKRLQRSGELEEALQATEGKTFDNYLTIRSGNMEPLFRKTDTGLTLQAIFDLTANQQLAAAEQLPFFQINLRRPHTANQEEEKTSTKDPEVAKLIADQGWSKVDVAQDDNTTTIKFAQPQDPKLVGLAVTLVAKPDPQKDQLAWSIAVQNDSTDWSLSSVTFPQVALADQGEEMSLLIPTGAGDVETGICRRNNYRFRDYYPNGWCTMQFEAVYCPKTNTGLYWAMHDPAGSVKYLSANVDPVDDTLTLGFEHPVPDTGKAGVDYELPGAAVWQFFRGDWFDASVIYRDWVRKHAKWYPQLSDNGREDTPLWMRELPAWAFMSGKPDGIVPAMKKFQAYLDVPVGIHWYCWHQIPFDNDYPHYFPTVDGFAEAVAELKKSNVHTMPYINGRIWDTHDRQDQDFEFTSKALPAATKQESGEPYLERYGSREQSGEKVALAPMCPTTKLWQDTIANIISRLYSECGVDGVYVDQVAAAQPKLCFDPTHGHPLGGGSWWNEGYWEMFKKIRADKPADKILTTECNADPFTKCFDGYLSWHWQNDGQVPAFSVVYGGAIQMFGRAFQGDSYQGDAMRMKVGQQLCFGEQIGWISPAIVDNKEDGPFFRQVVRLRYAFRRYFYAGEMARPPKLEGNVPTITADWRWGGSRIVTTPMILTGAWQLPKEHRAVLLLVNVSEKPVTTTVAFDPADYGFDGKQPLKVTVRTEVTGSEGKSETFTLDKGRREVTLPPLSAQAWELQ